MAVNRNYPVINYIMLNMSWLFVIILAPSFINSLQPSLCSLVISPGKAKTSFPCSSAKSAVIKAPLILLASTTNTPFDNPLIILFLLGKFNFSGLVSAELFSNYTSSWFYYFPCLNQYFLLDIYY